MIAAVIGIAFILIGGWGLVHWLADFMAVLRGFGPLSIFVGGVVALIAGLASFRPPRANGDDKE